MRSSGMPLCALLIACGADDNAPAVAATPTCAPLELALPDGSCIRPGIPPDGCAAGFAHDGEYGCAPVLPPEPCPAGLIAVPGDASCRPVMPCGEDRWGTLPVDATTEYVDGAYAGTDGDGSASRPWTSIRDAYVAAAPGALIAIAEGSYLEDVSLFGKPVRLWGVCPEKVEIVGTGDQFGAIVVGTQADGTEVGGMALRGAADGFALSGSMDVVVDRVWAHDTAGWGISADSALGTTSVEIRGSLLENNKEVGLAVIGARATLDTSVVRGTAPYGVDQPLGRGISIQRACDDQGACVRAEGVIRTSVVEQHYELAINVSGSDATVETTVVRSGAPGEGTGMKFQAACQAPGVCDGAGGHVRASVIDRIHEHGIMILGSAVSVESTVVRGTLPLADAPAFGRGITIQSHCEAQDICDATARAQGTVRTSLIEQNYQIGIVVVDSDATIEGTVVRGPLPEATEQVGRGILVQLLCLAPGNCDPTARGNGVVRASLVERTYEFGIHAAGADMTVEGSVVRNVLASADDGSFGDAASATSYGALASLTIDNTLLDRIARVGLANFGASISLGSTHVRCSTIDLDGEPFEGQSFVFEDRNGNACGCPTADAPCKVVSTGLAPPTPIQ